MNQLPLLDLADAPSGGMLRGALLSPCGTYRYTLDRIWDPSLPGAVFIMLNPSTADAAVDDPTIRRCVSFAQREKCGSLTVVNLFGLRSTDPRELSRHPDPLGPENDFHLLRVLHEQPARVIAAWGSHPFARARARAVAELLAPELANLKLRLTCLGTTKDGHPRHPLYVRNDAPLIPLRSTR